MWHDVGFNHISCKLLTSILFSAGHAGKHMLDPFYVSIP